VRTVHGSAHSVPAPFIQKERYRGDDVAPRRFAVRKQKKNQQSAYLHAAADAIRSALAATPASESAGSTTSAKQLSKRPSDPITITSGITFKLRRHDARCQRIVDFSLKKKHDQRRDLTTTFIMAQYITL
jgi:hypothetical protein